MLITASCLVLVLCWQLAFIESNAKKKGFTHAVAIASGVVSQKLFSVKCGYTPCVSFRYADVTYQDGARGAQIDTTPNTAADEKKSGIRRPFESIKDVESVLILVRDLASDRCEPAGSSTGNASVSAAAPSAVPVAVPLK